jgi:hypothetical protein
MSEIELKLKKMVNYGIRKTINKFREHPSIFFSETDIHSYLYQCLYNTRFEAKTKDGVTTSCLHKEYPTNFKFSKDTMKDYGLSKEGVRGHFDFVILNPQFIQQNSIATIENKNIRGTEIKAKIKDKLRNELLTAIELKYVVNNRRKFIDEVEKDIKKLSIGLKYQSFEAYNLVFCNCEYYYINELTTLIEKAPSNIKSVLVRSHYTKDMKNAPKPKTNGWNL